jgi:drug/metabolite transporter (DMT)-like permease
MFWLRGKKLQLPRADVGWAFLVGVLGVAASNYTYYFAIQRTNVATAIVLQYTAPVWVLLYMVLRGKQKVTAQRVLAVLLALAGIALVIGVLGGVGIRLDTLGVIAGLLAAFAFSFYSIGTHGMVARHDHWTVLIYAMFGAALFWLVVNPPAKVLAAHHSRDQWIFMVIFAVVSMLAPYSFYFAGLKYLEPTRAVIVGCLEPVFSILVAALTLGEGMRPLQIAGISLVLVAIVVVQRPERNEQEVVLVEPIE